jgi:predicted ribonuclease YlaK
MSLLKVSVLSISGLTLWLAPPFVFSHKIPLHNFMQGIALVSGFACCFEARRCALKVAKAEEFEAMKARAIDADVADELSTSIYVAEQQRRNEAELLIASSSDRELLERALALSSEEADEENIQLAENADTELKERILQLQARGYGKAKIILEIWGVSKGGSPKYKAAEAEYRRLTGDF